MLRALLELAGLDCSRLPPSLYGVTLYGQVVVGGGYETRATKFNKDCSNGVSELINKDSGGAKRRAAPNAPLPVERWRQDQGTDRPELVPG